jgi:uncharacterized protein YdeI (YjbR/CyaY-like superfamily)
VLRLARRGAGAHSISHPEALEEALAHGWIDAMRRREDDRFFLQRFTPRRRGSSWSKINRATAERLIAEGRMAPAGMRAVEEARANGRWDDAYDGQRTMAVPDDLAAALDERPAARALFDRLDSRNRYSLLFRIHQARRPETRARRIATFVDMLERGETLHPRRSG